MQLILTTGIVWGIWSFSLVLFIFSSISALYDLFMQFYLPIMVVSVVGSFAIACASSCLEYSVRMNSRHQVSPHGLHHDYSLRTIDVGISSIDYLRIDADCELLCVRESADPSGGFWNDRSHHRLSHGVCLCDQDGLYGMWPLLVLHGVRSHYHWTTFRF